MIQYNTIIDKQTVAELELNTVMDIIQEFGLDYEETTGGQNGYPSSLKWAITSDSIAELLQIEEELIDCGFRVEQVELNRKTGWNLWGRSNTYISSGYFQKVEDYDTALYLAFENDDSMTESLTELIYFNEDVDSSQYGFETKEDHIAEIISYLPMDGDGIAYLDPDNAYIPLKVVKEDDAFSSEDNNEYKLGLIIK